MVPLEVLWRSRFTIAVVIAALSACGGTPREASRPNVTTAPAADTERGHLDDPDLNREPPKKLLSIDWATTTLASDADALALWQRIAPTGADYSDKLDELPDEGTIVEQLAVALLREGNFTCTHPAPPLACARKPLDLPEPAPDATLADPCLRRVLAIWALSQLEDDQLAPVRDALRAIVAIPPPESELTAAALKALPETDHAGRLELLALAFRAGHRELVNGHLGTLDEAHLLLAVQKHHIDGALDLLSAETHRGTFLAAIGDDKLDSRARAAAMRANGAHAVKAKTNAMCTRDGTATAESTASARRNVGNA